MSTQTTSPGPAVSQYRQERLEALEKCRRVVVKVGSAVLTTPEGLNGPIFDSLVEELALLRASGREVVLVSSGAVAAGRAALGKSGMSPKELLAAGDLPARQAASAVGQSRLMHAYDKAFEKHGVISAQVLLTRQDLDDRTRFLNARNTLRTLLSWSVLPVVNENDTVATEGLAFGDNDALAALVLNLVEGDLYVNLTSADGVFDANPDTTPGAACIACVENVDCLDIESICGGKTSSGTGGMYSKLLAARRAAQIGVPTLICSGLIRHALTSALSGEPVGTWIRPSASPISSRKHWLAYAKDAEGELYVDAGAVRAIVQKGKSLLPVGITRVVGEFARGGLVKVKGPDGTVVGLGISNYDAFELDALKGRHGDEIEAFVGEAFFPEAIHRDNFLLDPAC